MHATQVRPRPQQRLDDEESFTVSRGSDRRSEPYSRSHHHSSRAEPYGSSSAAQRSFTDTSSRNRRSEDWRVAETPYASSAHDRYRDDVAAHPRPDDFHDRPEGWNGRPAESSQVYSSSRSTTRREWAKRDNHGHTSNSYSESRTWGSTSRHEETSRNGSTNDEWPREDTRRDRGRGRLIREESFIVHNRDSRTRDDLVTVDTTRDRRSSSWVEHNNEHWRKEDRPRGHEKDLSTSQGQSQSHPSHGVDRQWEPAAAWKSGERVDILPGRYERSDTLPPPRYNKKAAKNRKKAQLAMQKRDAKRDDNMNNWQKRDSQSGYKDRDIVKPSFGKRRHELSPDSRSRSPARSSYSRRSSNRSRSRSLSPKRRKRADEASTHANFVPATKKNDSRRSRSPDWSTGPLTKSRRGDESKARPRRTSISSRSSQSRSRSRSSSETPDTRPKPKHRLPTATSLHDIEMQAKSLRLSANAPARQSVDISNGPLAKRTFNSKQQMPASTNGKHLYQSSNYTEDMPPPTTPASASAPLNGISSSVHSSTVVVETSPKSSKRNAGFKPIGAVRSSPAIKRFFPGDEDESSITAGANQTKYHQDEQDPQPDNHKENGISSRQHREDWDASVPQRSNVIDVHHQREGRSKPEPARSGQHEDTMGGHRRQPARSSGVDVNGEISTKANNRLYQLSLDRARQTQVPSLKVEGHANGRILRKVSTSSGRQSETPSAMGSSHPSPAGPQAESTQATPMENPKDQVYAIVSQVGEGTFGKVYKARNNITGVLVALKRIRMETERDGFPVTAMREIKLLQSIRHVNIVQLMEMMVHHGSVYMVFEYMDHDLTGVLSQTQFSFTDAHLKSLCKQMLHGLSYLHRKGVIHRDIKGSNILLNNRGELKLADFGLARFYQKRRRADYTNRVITLWYRPPELLLGTTVYGPEVDMWSAGCIMLELFCKKPVFQGNDEIHQLDVIYKILGTPTPEEWPGVTDMPWYELVKPREPLRNRFRELFNRWLSPAALDLAERLLSYDPAQRATADQALEAAYFSQEPAPVFPVGLATLEGEWHELDSKRERAKKRRRVDPAAEPGSVDIPSQ